VTLQFNWQIVLQGNWGVIMSRRVRLNLSFISLTFTRLSLLQSALMALVVGAMFIAISPNASAQYATVGPNGGVILLNAPPVAFPSTGPEQGRAGISLADRAGISNNAAETMEVATLGSAGALYNGSAIANGTAVYNGAAVGTAEVPDGHIRAQSRGPAAKTNRDWGTSVFVGSGPVGGSVTPASGPPSLADIAARLKTTRGQSKRTYTNADAQRIGDNLKIRGTNRTLNPPNNVPPPPR
jgi:hypothetical protein